TRDDYGCGPLGSSGEEFLCQWGEEGGDGGVYEEEGAEGGTVQEPFACEIADAQEIVPENAVADEGGEYEQGNFATGLGDEGAGIGHAEQDSEGGGRKTEGNGDAHECRSMGVGWPQPDVSGLQ